MEEATISSSVPYAAPQLLARQWAETLHQTACLRVLVENQARLLALLSGRDTDQVIREAHEQIEASLRQLLTHYGHTPSSDADARPAKTTTRQPAVNSTQVMHPLADEAFGDD